MGSVKIFLHLPLAQLIFLYLAQISTSNAGGFGHDTYEWKPAANVSEAQRRRRPDGVEPARNKSQYHMISLARVNLGGHFTVGNYVPSYHEEVYFSWYNNGNPDERYVTDLKKWKVELLVHNLDSLSWVFNYGRLAPGLPGHSHVGKYQNGQWAVVCRAFVPKKKNLYVGKYLWTWGSNDNEGSNACLIGAYGKEHAVEGYEALQVNLIGRGDRASYPGITPDNMG